MMTWPKPLRKQRITCIGIMIGIVVGVNLISPVNNVVQTVTTPTYASSVVSLTGVLPIIFVTVIILGAIAWMGFRD